MLAPIFTQSDPTLLYQYVNITTMQGVVKINLQALDSFQRQRMLLVALFAVRAGCSALVSILLFLLTPRRTTPVYVFNQTSLILFFVQSTLFLVNAFSPFGAISTVFTKSYADVTIANVNVSVATSVFQLLFIITIQCSLVFQARTVFPRQSKAQILATMVLGCMSLATITLYTLYIAQTCWVATNPRGIPLFKGRFGNKLPSISQIMFAASISLSTFIFVGKLIVAIRTRRVLGLKQFGPLQIVCIMGAQSMIIPAVLTVVSFAKPGMFHIYSMAPFTVVVSLPLSAMWAASANTTPVPTSTSTINSSQIRKHIGSSSDHDDDTTTTGGGSRYNSYDFGKRPYPTTLPFMTGTDASLQNNSGGSSGGKWAARLHRFCTNFILGPSHTSTSLDPPITSSCRRPPPIVVNPARGSQTKDRELSFLDSLYTPSTSRDYMTRASYEARGNYRNKYDMYTTVSLSSISSRYSELENLGAYRLDLAEPRGEPTGFVEPDPEMQRGRRVVNFRRPSCGYLDTSDRT